MKSCFYFLLLLLISSTSCKNTDSSTLPLHNKRVLILGNSITQHGHYVDFMEYYLRKKYPKNQLDIISIGLSGETISGTSEPGRDFPRPNVHDRLERALQETKPELVLACYGMNDGNYHPLDSLRFEAYKKGVLKLQAMVAAANAKLILITPTVFDPHPIANRVSKEDELYSYWHPYYKYNTVLKSYSEWLLGLKNDTVHVIDLHHPLAEILANMKRLKMDSTYIPDGVHPNKMGHFYMAQLLLKDLYPEITMGNPMLEINRLKTDSLYLLGNKRRTLRSEGWRNYIGYTKGEKVKSNEISTTKDSIKSLDLAIRNCLQN